MGRALRTAIRRLPSLACALATVLSLLLSACAVFPAAAPTPAARPWWCVTGGEAGRPSPYFGLPVTTPVAADGVVYVGYTLPDPTDNPFFPHYAIAALRARDGMPLWHVPADRETEALVSADGVLLVYGKGAGEAVALRARDGATLWRARVFAVTPRGGVLYGITDVGIGAFRLVDGHILWQTHVQGGPIGTPVVDGTSVYVALGNGSVMALRADTGAVRWTAFPQDVPPSQEVWYIPVGVAAGQLYVTTLGMQAMNPGVLGLNVVDGTSDGYVLRLPADAQAQYSALMGGVFTAVISQSLPPGATPPGPPTTIAAYRLGPSGSQLIWQRVPVQEKNGFSVSGVAQDAQTFYLETLAPGPAPGVISAFRLADGAVLWRQQALPIPAASTPIAADSGYLTQTMYGWDNTCRTPAVHQAPQIRALATADGSVAWTRALDATL